MGTQRVGTLPDTVPWRRVIALLADDADVPDIAIATTEATLAGLRKARDDEGLVYTFFLLGRLALSARSGDFAAALCVEGIAVSDDPDLFDLAAAFTENVDLHLQRNHRRTDLGEMAQLAAVEAITGLLRQRCSTLFDSTPAEVHAAARQFSTEIGFGILAHEYFARFTQRFLTYHLGRELSQHVGGNGRFADPEEHNEFVGRLEVHCREAAAIVRDFAGSWYSKSLSPDGGGITRTRAGAFVAHALTKLHGEFTKRGARDV